jgi:hypothetical protein
MVDKAAVNADALSRAERLWQLRTVGLTWDECARRVGLANGQNAIRCVREAFGELPEPDRSEFRALVVARSEFLWREALRTLDAASTARERVAAIRAGQAVLSGLARVTGVEVERPYSPVASEIEAWVAGQLAAVPSDSVPVEAVVVPSVRVVGEAG